jgi:hypothetical protein
MVIREMLTGQAGVVQGLAVGMTEIAVQMVWLVL